VKESVRAKMRVMVKRILRKHGYLAAANLTGAGLPPVRQRDLARPRPDFPLPADRGCAHPTGCQKEAVAIPARDLLCYR